MLLASVFFASMGVCIKFASAHFNSFEIVFYRGVVGSVFLIAMTRVNGVSLRTRMPMMHVWRSIVGTISLTAWFFAIAALPLATAMTLNYMSGVWVAAFIVGGSLLYGESRKQGPLLGTVLLGFVGVVMTLRPTMDQNQLFAGLIGLLSGMGAALAYMQVTALGKVGEPEERTVLYFSIGTALVGALGMAVTQITPWSSVSWQDAIWVIPIGIFASMGQWCMTRAYSHGATLVVASMQYTGIVFASIFSLVLFGDHIAPIGWAGIAVIVASGLLATLLRARALPQTPAEEH